MISYFQVLWAANSPADEPLPLAIHRTRTVQVIGGHTARTYIEINEVFR
jgi:hypothetical protein